MKKMLSSKQKEFLLNPLARINLLYGSVRSGKTYISLLKWALWIGEQPKTSNFLMVGKTLTSLKHNCLSVLSELIGDNITFSMSQKTANIFGHTVWLEGANDERSESKIRGMTLKGCYIDELTQIPKSFYLMTLSRLSEKGAALIATTNPDAPTHYVKTDIIDNAELNKKILKYTLDDNDFLDSEYKENLKKEYTGVYYDRFILGEFVRAEGIVFRDFADKPEKYYIDRSEVEQIQEIGIGYDIGGNGSNYALVATAITKDDKVIVLKAKEILPKDLRHEDVERACIDFVKEVEEKYHKTSEYGYVDDAYWTIINGLNDWRYMFDNAARIKGSMPLHDRPLMLSKLMAQGRFKIVQGECEPLITQLQNAVYDEKKDKAVILDDGTMPIDCIDGFFYSIADNYLYLFEGR